MGLELNDSVMVIHKAFPQKGTAPYVELMPSLVNADMTFTAEENENGT